MNGKTTKLKCGCVATITEHGTLDMLRCGLCNTCLDHCTHDSTDTAVAVLGAYAEAVQHAARMCDFYGCNNDAVVDPDIKEGLQLCKTHDDEFAGLVKAEDTRGIMRFWVRSQGGAKRMMGDLS